MSDQAAARSAGRPHEDGGPNGRSASAERRAERKRARLAEPPPVRLPEYEHLTVHGLRDLRKQLGDEESRISYWRRIIQARIDLLENGAPKAGATAEGLTRVLREHSGTSRRTALLRVQPADGQTPLPDLTALWEHIEDGDEADAAFRADLRGAEAKLSAARGELHRRIDTVTGQLIARYREDPSLALSALPRRPGSGRQF